MGRTENGILVETIATLNRTNTKLLHERFKMLDEVMRLRKEVMALRKGILDYDAIKELENEIQSYKQLNLN